MLFDDEFVMGGGRFGGLDDAFGGIGGLTDLGGFGRFGDAGEVVIVGRVPGALYVDDISIGQTLLEHIQPMVAVEAMLTIEAETFQIQADIGHSVDETPVSEPPADEGGEEAPPADAMPLTIEKTSVVTAVAPIHRVEETLTAPAPIADDGDQQPPSIDPVDLPAQVRIIDAPQLPAFDNGDVTAAEPPASPPQQPVFGGRAYQQLSFLILDTPYVYGDDFLPVTVRPPLEQMLTPVMQGRFVLPQVSGWVLGAR